MGAATVAVTLAGCSGSLAPVPTPSVIAPSAVVASDWGSALTDDDSLYQMVLEGLNSFPIPAAESRPQVKLIRWVKPAEWAQAQVDCMAEQGFESTTKQGGIAYPETPPEQATALAVAMYFCQASFPVDPRINLPLPRDRAEIQFRYLVDTVAPCVRTLGVAVSEPPTFDVWFSAYATRKEHWDPYGDVLRTAHPEELDALLDRVYEQCPAFAPGAYPDDLRG